MGREGRLVRSSGGIADIDTVDVSRVVHTIGGTFINDNTDRGRYGHSNDATAHVDNVDDGALVRTGGGLADYDGLSADSTVSSVIISRRWHSRRSAASFAPRCVVTSALG